MGSHSSQFRLDPGKAPDLAARDPSATEPHLTHDKGAAEGAGILAELDRLQYLLYANHGPSLLIVLQGLDAAGKDGTIRHVFSGMNPQGVRVAAFKQPTPEEASHDFLWRAHKAAPARGEVVIFNRSHYEDVLVVRVHDLVPEPVWRARYDTINAFEAMLAANGTRILKFFLHISPEEQLARFAERLDTPAKRWKISESDYTERLLWDRYTDAYEEALQRTSTAVAPWFIIPSDHKWFRNLAVARIIAGALAEMNLGLPQASVDIDDIRQRFHAAKVRQG